MRGHCLLVAIACAVPAIAHADGTLFLRGAYYKEKATRVEQPMVDATFDTGDTGTIDAHLLVDAITSASSASGAVDTTFSERRWEAGMGYTRGVGDVTTVGVNGKISVEPDYGSYFSAAHLERGFAQKNFTLGLTAGFGYDSVKRLMPAPLGGSMLAMHVGSLKTGLGSVSATQLLSETALLGFTYDLTYLSGYQQNPYRRAITEDAGFVEERHPDQRTRHAIALTYKQYVRRTHTTLVATYRFYDDSWGVIAHTPELRLVQDAGDGLDVALRYRLHWQGAADFYEPTYVTNDVPYVSDDVKLSKFWAQTIGVTFGAEGRLFGLGGMLEDARGELTFEYVAQDNRFGNAVIANAGMSVPFEY
jgi:hypothetical protein